MNYTDIHHHHNDLPFRLLSWVKRRCWSRNAGCRSSEAWCWRRSTSGFISYGGKHFSWARDELELLASKRLFYVFVSRAAIDDLMHRHDNPRSFFLKIAIPSWLVVKTHKHSPGGRSHTSDTTVSVAIVDCWAERPFVRATVVAKGFWRRCRTLSRHYTWVGLYMNTHVYTTLWRRIRDHISFDNVDLYL